MQRSDRITPPESVFLECGHPELPSCRTFLCWLHLQVVHTAHTQHTHSTQTAHIQHTLERMMRTQPTARDGEALNSRVLVNLLYYVQKRYHQLQLSYRYAIPPLHTPLHTTLHTPLYTTLPSASLLTASTRRQCPTCRCCAPPAGGHWTPPRRTSWPCAWVQS